MTPEGGGGSKRDGCAGAGLCKWVASRLQMGDPTRVSTAVRQVQKAKKGAVAQLRKRMENGY